MTLHRFFVEPSELAGDRFPLPPRIAHQVRNVLRLRDGDTLVLLAGDGMEVRCRLEREGCAVEARNPAGGEPRHRLALVQALIKGDGLEQLIRQGTEIGVSRFVLVATQRSVLRELGGRRLERLRAVAREAAEQSERGMVPEVVGAPSLDAALDQVGSSAVLMAERARSERLSTLRAPDAIVVGPEGGLTEAEVDLATRRGLTLAGLGPRILRSESVALAAAAVILSRTGDFA